MVNLLPRAVRRKLNYAYYMRVFATFFYLSALVGVIGLGLLLPSYYLARNESESSQRYVEALEGTAGLKNRGQAGRIAVRFTEQVELLKKYERAPVTANMLSIIETNLSKEIIIDAIEVKYADSNAATITISGIAKNRTALLSFAEALREEIVFTGISVPVNQLAGESDLSFSLTFGFLSKTP